MPPTSPPRRPKTSSRCSRNWWRPGSVGWYGTSTDDPDKAELFASAPHCAALQIQLNVLDDNQPMLAMCEKYDLAPLCRSPLAMGLLGRPLHGRQHAARGRLRGRQPEWLRWFADGRPNPEFLERIDTVRAILTADGRTLAQGALAWIWAHDERAVPLPGFRNSAQVDDNTGALRLGALSADQHDAVERALGR